MCQGHEDSAPKGQRNNVPSSSSSSGQQSQSDQKKKQRFKNKQQRQQIAKEQTPPATSALPTHEIVKSGSTKLANGTRYIDVPPLKSRC